MIIKNLSRRGNDSHSRVIKYIFRKEKLSLRSYGKVLQALPSQAMSNSPVYVAGIRLTKNDIKHLLQEKQDAKLTKELKEFRGTLQEFIQFKLSGTIDKQQVIVKHNLRGKTLEENIQEFRNNEDNRIHKSSRQASVHHTILAWSNEDSEKITDNMLKDMLAKFVQLRGENNLYLGTVHREKDHVHVHVAMSATRIDGMASRISKEAFQDIKIQLEAYQKERYPELSKSVVQHRNKSDKGKEGEKKYKCNERTKILNDLNGKIAEIIRTTTSSKDFLNKLELAGYNSYSRSGKLTGVIDKTGFKFRFSRLECDMKDLGLLDEKLERDEKELSEIAKIRRGENRSKEREILNSSARHLELEQVGNVKDKDTRLREISEMNREFEDAHSIARNTENASDTPPADNMRATNKEPQTHEVRDRNDTKMSEDKSQDHGTTSDDKSTGKSEDTESKENDQESEKIEHRQDDDLEIDNR